MELKSKTCQNKGCNNTFIPYRSTDKYCSFQCANANKKEAKKTSYIIPKKSKKMKELDKIYSQLRKVFLDIPKNQVCPVTGMQTNQVHHKKGRIGYLYLYTPLWLAVSQEGHDYIHANPSESYKKGWLIRSTTKE